MRAKIDISKHSTVRFAGNLIPKFLLNLHIRLRNYIYFDILRQHPKYKLEKLIKQNNIRSYAEIGVWEGETASHLLKKCKKLERVYCIDNYDSFDTMGGANEDFEKVKQVALKRMGWSNKVKFIYNKSEDAVKKFEDESIDMVFIDADHSFEAATRDINLWYPKVRKNGIVSGHNYETRFFGVMQAVNKIFTPFQFSLIGGTIWCVKK